MLYRSVQHGRRSIKPSGSTPTFGSMICMWRAAASSDLGSESRPAGNHPERSACYRPKLAVQAAARTSRKQPFFGRPATVIQGGKQSSGSRAGTDLHVSLRSHELDRIGLSSCAKEVIQVTIPQQYTQASRLFELFLLDVRDALGHHSTHVTYTTVQAVLVTFRCRLKVRDALRFADALPAVLRAIFVSEWDTDIPPRAFGSRIEHTAEAQGFRRDHSFIPDDAIAVVASVLSRHVDRAEMTRVLADLPPGARDFWAGSPLVC